MTTHVRSSIFQTAVWSHDCWGDSSSDQNEQRGNLILYFIFSFHLWACVLENKQFGFRPGPTQTRLYSHRRWIEARNFGFRK